MLPVETKLSVGLRLKRTKFSDSGQRYPYGYVLAQRLEEDGKQLVFIDCFTHPNERPERLTEKQARTRYELWTEKDDEALRPKPVEDPNEWIDFQSSRHCVFCGEIMGASQQRKGGPVNLRCERCGIVFFEHGIRGEDTSPGDSFSITYLH